jgi:hypothetical protein
MRNDIIAILNPDTHGRGFWKEVAKKYDGSVPFIFLGDYLDTYPAEGISDEEARKNFEEIWEFKQKWGDKVILLLGNHDLSYYDSYFRCCRFSYDNAIWFHDFLKEHWDDFKIAYEIDNNGKKFLFTHAGVHPSWLKYHNFENTLNANYINSLFRDNNKVFYEYSFLRGGYMMAGSPVWADIREFVNTEPIDENVMQIVGHTQLQADKVNLGQICCIDSRQTFVITKNNDIETYIK